MASAVKRFVQQFKVTGRIWGARVRHAGMARPASVVGDSRHQQQADRHHQLVLGFCSGISVLAQHGAGGDAWPEVFQQALRRLRTQLEGG